MTSTSRTSGRTNWKRVAFQAGFVVVVLAVDAIIAAIVSPGIYRIHLWMTLPGVMLVRAIAPGTRNLFVFTPPTWGEIITNAAICCSFAAVLAFLHQTRRPWRNIFRFVYAAALMIVLAAWLVPHHPIKPWGGKTRSVTVLGDGTVLIAYTEIVDLTRRPPRDFKFVHRELAPGVQYDATTGPRIESGMRGLANLFSDSPNKRPIVTEHTYTVRMWWFLLPFLGYPAVICLIWFLKPKPHIVCSECGYHLTHHRGRTCPGCRAPNPRAEASA